MEINRYIYIDTYMYIYIDLCKRNVHVMNHGSKGKLAIIICCLTLMFKINKPKMAYSRDAFIRDKQETRER